LRVRRTYSFELSHALEDGRHDGKPAPESCRNGACRILAIGNNEITVDKTFKRYGPPICRRVYCRIEECFVIFLDLVVEAQFQAREK
jgi:hypothetical protein